METNKKKMSLFDMWHFVIFQTKAFKITRVAIILSAIFGAAITYVNYIMYSKVLSRVMEGKFDEAIRTAIILSILVCVTSLTFHISKNIFDHYALPSQLEIKRRTVFKIYSMQYDKVSKRESLDALRNIKFGEMGMGGVFYQLNDISDFFREIVSVIYAFIFMVILFLRADFSKENLGYTLVFAGILAAAFVLVLYMNRILTDRLGKAATKMNKENERVNALGRYLFELLYSDNSLKDIRIYGMQKYLLKKLEVLYRSGEAFSKHGIFSGRIVGCQAFLLQVFSGITYSFIAVQALNGAIPVADIIMYGGAIITLNTSIQSLIVNKIYIDYRNEFLKGYENYINSPDMDYDGTLPVEKRDDNNYSIEFKNVWFRYDESEDYVLKDFSLKFNIGEKLAIVGLNGAGKTTIVKLLCRLYNPEKGEILLNGININKYDYDEYVSIFSVVFQDYSLFNFPLDENVAGSEDVDKERFESAIEKVGLSERIRTLPDGARTLLGHENGDGVSLSGGEGQKLAIARALYKDAPFIILDEPTAALDPIAESEIYENFDGLINNKTAIYISHRMSSCKFCDRIVVVGNGGILEEGSHMSLIERAGVYANLYNSQAEYYVG